MPLKCTVLLWFPQVAMLNLDIFPGRVFASALCYHITASRQVVRFGEGAPCCCCCARPGDGRSHRLLPSQQRVDSGVLLEGTGQLSPAQTNQGRLLGQNNSVQGRVFCSIRSMEGIRNKPYWVVGKVSPWHKCAHFSLPCPLFPFTSLPPALTSGID